MFKSVSAKETIKLVVFVRVLPRKLFNSLFVCEGTWYILLLLAKKTTYLIDNVCEGITGINLISITSAKV